MLTLSNTILSVSTRAGVLRKSTLLQKKLTKRARQILASRVSTKNTNGRIKLGVNHRGKRLIGSKHLSSRIQEVHPCQARKIINKDHIISMSPFRNKRSRAPYIRVNQIKRPNRHSLTSRILKL